MVFRHEHPDISVLQVPENAEDVSLDIKQVEHGLNDRGV